MQITLSTYCRNYRSLKGKKIKVASLRIRAERYEERKEYNNTRFMPRYDQITSKTKCHFGFGGLKLPKLLLVYSTGILYWYNQPFNIFFPFCNGCLFSWWNKFVRLLPFAAIDLQHVSQIGAFCSTSSM